MKFKDGESFWPNNLDPYVRPIDYAVKSISPGDAYGFVRGCLRITDFTRMIDPSIAFVAERGGGPIFWAADRAAELKGNQEWLALPRVYLPIGSGYDDQDFSEWGPQRHTKTKIIKNAVNRIAEDLAREGKPIYERALIIDEVQNGGTITCLTKDLKNIALGMDPRINDKPIAKQLHVIAMEDTRFKLPDRQKARGYKAIVGNSRNDIFGTVIRLPLFTVDRQIFLNHLMGSNAAADSLGVPAMMVPNLKAQRFIESLVDVVFDPSSLSRDPEKFLRVNGNSDDVEGRVSDREILDWYKEITLFDWKGSPTR